MVQVYCETKKMGRLKPADCRATDMDAIHYTLLYRAMKCWKSALVLLFIDTALQ
jgi:hypothetical protein